MAEVQEDERSCSVIEEKTTNTFAGESSSLVKKNLFVEAIGLLSLPKI